MSMLMTLQHAAPGSLSHGADRPTAAHAGDRMCHAHIRVIIPGPGDVTAVRRAFERLAGHLMVDIRLADVLGAQRCSCAWTTRVYPSCSAAAGRAVRRARPRAAAGCPDSGHGSV